MSEPIKVPADATAITSDIELPQITPAQFLAELEAQGIKTTVDGETKPAEGEKPAETGEGVGKIDAAKPNGEDPAEAEKVDAAKVEETKAEDEKVKAEEKIPEAKPDDSAEVKAARKIYAAAARKEASTLKTAQQAKTLQAQIDHIVKLRDEDPAELLKFLGFGSGTEADPVKDVLGRIVTKGEKPAPTLEEKVAALESQLAREKTEATKRGEEAIVTAAKARVIDAVKAAGEKFDLVNAFGAHDRVTDVMEEYYNTHGVPIDPMLAAEHVEKDLAAGLAKSTKFKAPGPAAFAAKPGTTSNGNKPTSAATGKSETLTNTDSGRTEPTDDFPMDDHDARAKAVAKAMGMGFSRN